MKLTFSIGFAFLAAGLLFVSSCKSDPKVGAGNEAAQPEEAEKTESPNSSKSDAAPGSITPDHELAGEAPDQVPITTGQTAAGYVQLLQGNWQNESNPDEVISFQGDRLSYFVKGQEQASGAFAVDYSCENSSCSEKSGNPVGWCMVQRIGASQRCMVVTRLDRRNLVLRQAGGSSGKVLYRKQKG